MKPHQAVPRKIILAALLAGSLLLGACSASPQAKFYTLASSPPEQQLCAPQQSPNLQVELLNFPDQLRQPQIATRPQPNRIEYAEFHHWAGSLENDFLGNLVANLQQLCPSGTFVQDYWPDPEAKGSQLLLDVSRFDGSLAGEVTLTAHWSLRDERRNATLAESNHSIRVKVMGEDYTALVAAQSTAVAQLASEILQALQD